MMPAAPKVKFGDALATANAIAADRERDSTELLWGHVAARAARDDGFRHNLTANPEEAVKEEAQKLNISVAPEQLEKAKELFGSPVLPGIDRQKVETLIFGTIEDVRTSFKLTLQLSRALFVVGLLLLLASAFFTFYKGAGAGAIFGSGGVISLVASLIMNPLDRIRNAGANLVQVQMAYLAYYNLLYLLGTRGENLPFADAKLYADEFRQSATWMMSAVQRILESSGAQSSQADSTGQAGKAPGGGAPNTSARES